MTIKLYDKVELKTGETAHIVEIYEQGVEYEADIFDGEDYTTDTIKQENIKKIILG